ncbi:pentapeptide repeat-containing protein [Candidatus Albibeggiatoa sp. nov. NOAA]|uniref:pentapeptide repeat-containing protein n=1 Tax=Candidatus Albibeggiatoa sp. nov. NOAA TaxID=3162724 RepID=UPI0032F4C1A7|nr:pentapeptide repeat-containing protein [Thiotrichaceae bacterium]
MTSKTILNDATLLKSLKLNQTMNNPETVSPKPCEYIDPEGQHCQGAAGEHGLCFWHDPKTDKSDNTIKSLLEQWAQQGRSMTGFSLRYADLSGIHLNGEDSRTGFSLHHVDLYRANLQNAHLYNIDLSHSCLMKANLSAANLNHANLSHANLLGTNFKHAKVEHVNWNLPVLQERQARLLAKHNKTSEVFDLFEQAEEIYRNLRRTAEARGAFEQAGKFFYREMVMRRYQMPIFSLKRFFSKMVDLLCGYGEKPFRVAGFSSGFIIFFAICYFLLGIQSSSGMLVFHPNNTMLENLQNFANCFYFSVVTFTTLGYGDIAPVGLSRLFAALEAFSGTFMTALFVVVFVKKMTR